MPTILSRIVDIYVFRRAPAGVEFLQLRRRADSRVGGTWQSVHGAIEPGETAANAARRELLEETGLCPLRFWQLEQVNTFFVAAEDAIHLCATFAAEVAADATVRINIEHDDFRWILAAEARTGFMWPGQRACISEILDTIIPPDPSEPFLRLPC